jgi:D-beta-D-heptose 7-phosphate kinase / D-beta-D-heptose 1-phosphate adenosyltransferase
MTNTPLSATEALTRLSDRTLWVVGDLMLDEYLTGPVERISPEAPVPVLRAHETETRAGGAANVARQIAALGARVILGGVVGSDDAASALLAHCRHASVDTRAVVTAPARRTTRKLRCLSKSQQLLRVDWEDTTSVGEACISQLLSRLAASPPPDMIVVSDYAKGVVSERLIESVARLKTGNCRIIVDPKRADFAAYHGAQILTPNLAELRQASSGSLDAFELNEIASVALALVRQHGFDALVVTLGERGLLLARSDGPYEYIPAVRRAVFDVTGAGDTVIGVLTAALAGGASLTESAQLANAAAGVAVSELGTTAVTTQQIRHALAGDTSQKILDRAALTARAATWRLAGKRIVFTNGCFDLLHAGHLALLHSAAQQGDVLVLAINSDASVRRLKGPDRPLVPAAARAELLAALECVDAVTIFSEDTPLETIRAVRPQVLVKGADYRAEDVVGRSLVESDGGKVVLVPIEDGWSTTELVERMRRNRP